jgi:hypothetical protein
MLAVRYCRVSGVSKSARGNDRTACRTRRRSAAPLAVRVLTLQSGRF